MKRHVERFSEFQYRNSGHLFWFVHHTLPHGYSQSHLLCVSIICYLLGQGVGFLRNIVTLPEDY